MDSKLVPDALAPDIGFEPLKIKVPFKYGETLQYISLGKFEAGVSAKWSFPGVLPHSLLPDLNKSLKEGLEDAFQNPELRRSNEFTIHQVARTMMHNKAGDSGR